MYMHIGRRIQNLLQYTKNGVGGGGEGIKVTIPKIHRPQLHINEALYRRPSKGSRARPFLGVAAPD